MTSEDLNAAREFAKVEFASAVSEFSPDEKECITFVVDRVNKTLLDNNLALMANHPWRFIKIEDWLCGGFAHTRGTYIILSQRHIDFLTKSWSKNMTPEEENDLVKKFGALIVHEQMHSLQRTFKSKFITLYTQYWNFVNANVEAEEQIAKNQVSNPDAPIAEWIIPAENGEYFWVRTLIKETPEIAVMGRDFTDRVFVIEKDGELFKVKKDEKGQLVFVEMSEIDFYANSFPVTTGIDHPNEISAYMFADYFKSIFADEKPFENINPEAEENTKQFIEWINKYMVN